uniref:Uncharacterized protein n=1 Tax=Romanomermis culicivorax TaxID=13658 RepID=A0A915KKW6_ROMCU
MAIIRGNHNTHQLTRERNSDVRQEIFISGYPYFCTFGYPDISGHFQCLQKDRSKIRYIQYFRSKHRIQTISIFLSELIKHKVNTTIQKQLRLSEIICH